MKAYEEIIEFIASRNPREVVDFKPSGPASQQPSNCYQKLIFRNYSGLSVVIPDLIRDPSMIGQRHLMKDATLASKVVWIAGQLFRQ